MTGNAYSASSYYVKGNGLSPVQRQAITWTNAGLLSIRLLGTNFGEIRIRITFIQEHEFEIVVYQICGHFVSASMC